MQQLENQLVVAISSRALFDLEESHRVFVDKGVEAYCLYQRERENEVLGQLTHGLTNKEIAQALGISYETVKEHVQHILKKIGVSDRTQAAVWAVRNNLV